VAGWTSDHNPAARCVAIFTATSIPAPVVITNVSAHPVAELSKALAGRRPSCDDAREEAPVLLVGHGRVRERLLGPS
jgi:hypothetical protein